MEQRDFGLPWDPFAQLHYFTSSRSQIGERPFFPVYRSYSVSIDNIMIWV
jgi:hypothetical protein